MAVAAARPVLAMLTVLAMCWPYVGRAAPPFVCNCYCKPASAEELTIRINHRRKKSLFTADAPDRLPMPR
eukprot:7255776-Prymnesium_polylepis.1